MSLIENLIRDLVDIPEDNNPINDVQVTSTVAERSKAMSDILAKNGVRLVPVYSNEFYHSNEKSIFCSDPPPLADEILLKVSLEHVRDQLEKLKAVETLLYHDETLLKQTPGDLSATVRDIQTDCINHIEDAIRKLEGKTKED